MYPPPSLSYYMHVSSSSYDGHVSFSSFYSLFFLADDIDSVLIAAVAAVGLPREAVGGAIAKSNSRSLSDMHVSSSSSDMYPPPHLTCMYPPPHMACMYPPPHTLMTCMYPPPHEAMVKSSKPLSLNTNKSSSSPNL